MLKFLLIAGGITYLLRRVIFTPVPGSKAFYESEIEKQKKEERKKTEIDFTDYEEIN